MDASFSNVIIIIILLIVLSLSIKSSIRHFKGEGSCCGGGSKDIKVKPKKLEEVKYIKVVSIEGMHCEHCYARVHNVLNSIDGLNAAVHGKSGIAVIRFGREIDDEMIISAIEELGYKVVSIKEKK